MCTLIHISICCQVSSQKSLTDKSSLTKPNPSAAGRPNRNLRGSGKRGLQVLWHQSPETSAGSYSLKPCAARAAWYPSQDGAGMDQDGPTSLNEQLQLPTCNSTGNTFTQIWHWQQPVETATHHWCFLRAFAYSSKWCSNRAPKHGLNSERHPADFINSKITFHSPGQKVFKQQKLF